jgi:hypothetical protein
MDTIVSKQLTIQITKDVFSPTGLRFSSLSNPITRPKMAEIPSFISICCSIVITCPFLEWYILSMGCEDDKKGPYFLHYMKKGQKYVEEREGRE